MQTRRELDRNPEGSLPRASFGELLGQLATNSAALVRDDVAALGIGPVEVVPAP